MTQRERVMLTTLMGAMLLLGGGLVFHLFVWQPLSEARGRLDNAHAELTKKQTELAKEQAQIDAILRVNPRLAFWKKTSLPPIDPALKKKRGLSTDERQARHLNRLQSDYERYLSELLTKSGFTADTISITARAPDRKTSPVLHGKVPVYERLNFSVTGRTTLEGMVRMLYDFHRTNLLHQIRNIHVTLVEEQQRGGGRRGGGRANAGVLNVTMTVEALVVTGAEERTALLPTGLKGQPRVLAEPGRRYGDMSAKHMFVGVAAVSSRYSEDRAEVLKVVRLTSLTNKGRRWEACLYDQGKGGDEIKLNAVTVTDFTIRDKYDTMVLEGTVVHLDAEQMVFKSEGKFYRVRLGDFLHPAVNRPLSSEELEKLGLSPGT
jgi:hypothetical protein